jgi:hypothetical protein
MIIFDESDRRSNEYGNERIPIDHRLSTGNGRASL